jgi:hypothetical protein
VLQAGNQALRHVHAAHPLLGHVDRIRDAAMLPNALFDIEYGVGGVRVGIAGLPDTAWIDDQAVAVERLGLTIDGLLRIGIATVGHHLEDDRRVGMSDQAVGSLEMREIQRRDQGIEDVLPDWFAWTAMR